MKRLGLAIASGLLLYPTVAVAQDTPTLFTMYYRCSQLQEGQADEAVQESLGPLIQQQVDAGTLSGWGWLSHRQGGAWRKALYMAGTDRSAMMDARGEIFSEFLGTDAAADLNGSCPGHDDYIWTGVSNSPGGADATPAPAVVSSYHVCSRAREGRADEIFEDLLAPLYKKHTDLGHLSTWGWWSHRSGGRFRRLETMSGADANTLMDMTEAIYGEAGETDPLALQEFLEICDSHVDYMWARPAQ